MNRPYIMRRARRGFSVYIKGKTYELPKEFIDTTCELKIFQDEQGFYLVSSQDRKVCRLYELNNEVKYIPEFHNS
ncbi:hypothetical protein [Campylobacter fetus]|uniref:hypothetical protein n=1 Tax=Campylobacter fetus TaxID=196 RepID=UPI0003E3EF21|nr:hypothetical protein [Campylobacter fetus]OCS27919.1 hypothetical protein CFV33872_05710 [Campylobacter fetus subsp. venerealis CCUG 33872]OCS36439.1 hypothetical protein AWR32_05940 [Campylobacter fetus subsp. venerealis]OCS38741.1 hypothetical protein AWR30_05290 [Campylobacter fetus subsp. venerealis]QMS61278.1 hypothetical protein GZ988_001815 [Campylobacter fetus]WKW21059.1 hypothetical protein IXZ14_01580 [Campylobacter fetus subsp. venerealis]